MSRFVPTRLTHHILHRMPFQLVSAPAGRWVLAGASAEKALLGCGMTLLQRKAEAGEERPVLMGDLHPDLGALFGVDGGSANGGSFEAELRSGAVVVWLPFVGATCPKEREVLDQFAAALEKQPSWSGEIWMYETTEPLWANRGIDGSGFAGAKADALRAFVASDELDAVLGLNRYRGLRPVVAYAEAFLKLSASRFLGEYRRWRA